MPWYIYFYQANYYTAEKKAFWKLIKNLSAFHVAGLWCESINLSYVIITKNCLCAQYWLLTVDCLLYYMNIFTVNIADKQENHCWLFIIYLEIWFIHARTLSLGEAIPWREVWWLFILIIILPKCFGVSILYQWKWILILYTKAWRML